MMIDVGPLAPNASRFNFGIKDKMLFLVVYHPVHEEENTSENVCQIMDAIFSLKEYPFPVI